MPTDYIRYDLLVQDALRSVVRKVLTDAARGGLPGEHHFNISFKTQAPGVIIPAQVRQRYPDEMAIILQHEFWDLAVTPDAFEVGLNFSRRPERLTVPFDAITGFSDPSVPFGFKIEPRIPADIPAIDTEPKKLGSSAPPKPPLPAPPPIAKVGAPTAGLRALDSQRPTEKPPEKAPEKSPEKPKDGEAAKVVSIDAFRKK